MSTATANGRLTTILERLDGVRCNGKEWMARCPAHEDGTASLSVSEGKEGRVLLKCHANCETKDVVKAMGLTMADLMPPSNGNIRERIVATYDYCTADGTLVYQAVRKIKPDGEKTFPQRRPDGNGGWIWNMDDVDRVLYRLPELTAAGMASTIFIPEGEKDVDRLRSLGLIATCNVAGAGKWRSEYSDCLARRTVVILPDNDKAGREHAEQVAASLDGKAESVKVVELPGLAEKQDVSDWLDAGGTLDELLRLVGDSPEWEVGQLSVHHGEHLPATGISNVQVDADDVLPIPMAELVPAILARTNDWPRAVEDSLFCDDRDRGVIWFDGASSLFGWLAGRCGVVDWRRIHGACSKEGVFHELRRRVTRYGAIEQFPHCPIIDGHYYTCEQPKTGDGRALEKLLDFFCPETALDRQLLTCTFATPLWGGLPGGRPAFMFTSTAGRGKGKTKTAEFVARLYGGAVTISPTEDINTIKTRLLSPEALSKRCALCDNVKTPRFSWGDLEALITCDTINGKRLYVGDASRPNYLTWMITLNGASLSTDMAQRTIEIKLGTPTYTGDWEEAVAAFVELHRPTILGDLTAFLQRPRKTIARHSRWGTWENAVLSRVDDPDGCSDLIAERRGAVDAEQEEGDLIQDYFASRLRSLGYQADTADAFIPNDIVAEWYIKATGNRRAKTTGITRAMKQLHDEGRLPNLDHYRDGHTGSRGFRWVGEHADAGTPTDYEIKNRLAKARAKQEESGEW